MHESSVESTGATATPTKTISSGVSIANSAGSISGGRRPGRRGEGTCVWAELTARANLEVFRPEKEGLRALSTYKIPKFVQLLSLVQHV